MLLHSQETDQEKTCEAIPMKALGMIEVYGCVAAIEALDSALKAANVKTVEVVPVKSGLVAVMVTGDVGAVNAAVSAAAAAAARVGMVISTHVIPRPAEGTQQLLENGPARGLCGYFSNYSGDKSIAPHPLEDTRTLASAPSTNPSEEEDAEQEEAGVSCAAEFAWLTKEEMQKMTVADLRSTARKLDLPNMSRHDIRYAKKEQLIRVMNAYFTRRG